MFEVKNEVLGLSENQNRQPIIQSQQPVLKID